jgi:uncharacterized protein YdeI (YjbR/CyaY-like superfamily)/molybdopterin converting factor small subunit
MALVHVPRSLAALFPSLPRRLEVQATDVAGLIRALDAAYPGMWDRLCEPGPRLRQHINAFVDGRPADLADPLRADSVVHIIPAVSGGEVRGERLHAESVAEWRAWLRVHHARDEGVWLVQWKPRTGRPAIPYEEAIEEALCVGWVDGTYRSLDEERGMLWYAPRRKGSVWARSNRDRVARLEAAGRMTPAGRAAVERAHADGSWSILESVEQLIVPADLATELGLREGARATWDSWPPTARRAYLAWIVMAKRPETRARRVRESADLIAMGRRFEQR